MKWLEGFKAPRNAVYKTRLLSLYETKMSDNRTRWDCSTKVLSEANYGPWIWRWPLLVSGESYP